MSAAGLALAIGLLILALDILVANHARVAATPLRNSPAEIELTFAVNTRATLLVQAFAAQHDGRPGGRVVLFTSGQYHGAMPGELPSIASKDALPAARAGGGAPRRTPPASSPG